MKDIILKGRLKHVFVSKGYDLEKITNNNFLNIPKDVKNFIYKEYAPDRYYNIGGVDTQYFITNFKSILKYKRLLKEDMFLVVKKEKWEDYRSTKIMYNTKRTYFLPENTEPEILEKLSKTIDTLDVNTKSFYIASRI